MPDTYTRTVAEWWIAVIRELNAMPYRKYPELPISEGARLKIAEAMDRARAKGAVEPASEVGKA